MELHTRAFARHLWRSSRPTKISNWRGGKNGNGHGHGHGHGSCTSTGSVSYCCRSRRRQRTRDAHDIGRRTTGGGAAASSRWPSDEPDGQPRRDQRDVVAAAGELRRLAVDVLGDPAELRVVVVADDRDAHAGGTLRARAGRFARGSAAASGERHPTAKLAPPDRSEHHVAAGGAREPPREREPETGARGPTRPAAPRAPGSKTASRSSSSTPGPSSRTVTTALAPLRASSTSTTRVAVAHGVVEHRLDGPLEQVGAERDGERRRRQRHARARCRARRRPAARPRRPARPPRARRSWSRSTRASWRAAAISASIVRVICSALRPIASMPAR